MGDPRVSGPLRIHRILDMTFRRFLPAALAAVAVVQAPRAEAQAWSYPAFQLPTVTSREFNFAVADAGGYGTSLVFQWRESGSSPRTQLSFDAGVGAPDSRRADNALFAFGQYAYQMHRASADVPIDFLFTMGAGVAVGSGTVLRVPAGVSLGRRFDLDGDFALTPWIHPRLSLDICSCNGTNSELGVAFDVGMNLEVSRRIAFRVAALFAGNELFNDDAIGISLAWTPPGLARQARR
jgi:hypothetical protein